jgi:hypothetical protein
VKSGQVVTLPSTKQWFLTNIWCWCISGDHPKNDLAFMVKRIGKTIKTTKKNWQANLPELAS